MTRFVITITFPSKVKKPDQVSARIMGLMHKAFIGSRLHPSFWAEVTDGREARPHHINVAIEETP